MGLKADSWYWLHFSNFGYQIKLCLPELLGIMKVECSLSSNKAGSEKKLGV